MDRDDSLQVLASGPSSAYLFHPAAINQLPRELIIVIFHLCLDPRTDVKVRTRLLLVCRYWKAIIEGTPSFWTHIKAADGLQHACNAITKTGESTISLVLGIHDSVSVGKFLAAAREKVSRWRSVELTFRGAFPTSFGGLQTSTCNSLEKIRLWWDEIDVEASTLTVFDGGPAPETLKDVFFCSIPVNLAPMRLSKLSSLVLIGAPHVQMDDILPVLRNSPALTVLNLHQCGSLHPLGGNDGLPIILGSLTAYGLELSTPSIHFLLSLIHAPSLAYLELVFDTKDSYPDSSMFSSPVPAFKPTLKRLLSTAKHIKLEFEDGESSITFGGLKIVLDSAEAEGFQYVRDMLDSLMNYSGEKRKDLKIHLHFYGVNPTIEELQILNRCPMPVERLTLTEEFWSRLIPTHVIGALGTRLAAGPHGWLFPELEVLEWNITLENTEKLETALDKRYCAAQSARQLPAEERQHPRMLKELRFFSKDMPRMESVDMERARRLHILAGGAKIFVRDALIDFDTLNHEPV